MSRDFVGVVTGIPRSGTSLLMQMLAAGGLPPLCDDARPPDRHNPRGYFELEAVKRLAREGAPWLAEARGRVVKVIHALAPALPAGPEYRVVWIERPLAAVLASQDALLGAAAGGSHEATAAVFTDQLAALRRWLEAHAPGRWLHLDYDAVLADPAAAAAALDTLFGGGLDCAAMARAVEPALGRQRAGYTRPAMTTPRGPTPHDLHREFDALDPARLRQSRGEKWSLYPEDVLPLWVADMDYPVAEPIRRVLQAALDRPDLGYPVHPAPTDLPELVCKRMQERFGWSVEPGRVELLTDVVQGMYVAVERLSEEGDGVVVQTPIYPPFFGAVRELRRRLIESPLRGDAGYRMDLEGLRAIDDARVLLLCNPHNPSGRAFRRDELEALLALAEERDWRVVSDEIHSDLVYPGHEHVPFASLSPAAAARTITLTAASKAFNIAGLRCAVAIFGSDELARSFRALPRKLRGGLGILGIEATRAAWREGDPWLDAVRSYLEANRDFLADFVARELPGVVHHRPEATYLAWLDFRSSGLEGSPFRFFLDQARVAGSEGASFGAPGRGFLRINFATSRRILSEALERMAKAWSALERQ